MLQENSILSWIRFNFQLKCNDFALAFGAYDRKQSLLLYVRTWKLHQNSHRFPVTHFPYTTFRTILRRDEKPPLEYTVVLQCTEFFFLLSELCSRPSKRFRSRFACLVIHLSWKTGKIGLIFFFFFWTSSTAYGSSQARGRVRNAAASLHHSHSNTGSEWHLWPTPQLMSTPEP